MPKQSSFLTDKGCFLKATGLRPRSFREARLDGADEANEAGMPGCQGDGIELPTSLPASEAEIDKYN